MAPTKIAISPHGVPGSEGSAGPLTRSRPAAGAIDRDQLLDRLQHLRTVLPIFAQVPASTRRQTAQLCIENRRVLEEVRRLRQQRGESIPFATMVSMLGEARTALSRRCADS